MNIDINSPPNKNALQNEPLSPSPLIDFFNPHADKKILKKEENKEELEKATEQIISDIDGIKITLEYEADNEGNKFESKEEEKKDVVSALQDEPEKKKKKKKKVSIVEREKAKVPDYIRKLFFRTPKGHIDETTGEWVLDTSGDQGNLSRSQSQSSNYQTEYETEYETEVEVEIETEEKIRDINGKTFSKAGLYLRNLLAKTGGSYVTKDIDDYDIDDDGNKIDLYESAVIKKNFRESWKMVKSQYLKTNEKDLSSEESSNDENGNKSSKKRGVKSLNFSELTHRELAVNGEGNAKKADKDLEECITDPTEKLKKEVMEEYTEWAQDKKRKEEQEKEIKEIQRKGKKFGNSGQKIMRKSKTKNGKQPAWARLYNQWKDDYDAKREKDKTEPTEKYKGLILHNGKPVKTTF